MDLTNEDVTDILALLDSLPYDELDLQTPRFRLTLRRTPDGWTQSTDTRVAPTVVDVAPAGGAAARGWRRGGPRQAAGGPGGRCGGPRRAGCGGPGGRSGNRPNGPSGRL